MAKVNIFSKEYQEIITRDDPTRTRDQLLKELNPATCLDCGYTRDEPCTNFEALCKACKPNAIVTPEVLSAEDNPYAFRDTPTKPTRLPPPLPATLKDSKDSKDSK